MDGRRRNGTLRTQPAPGVLRPAAFAARTASSPPICSMKYRIKQPTDAKSHLFALAISRVRSRLEMECSR